MKKKEERAQRALGTFPTGIRLTDTGKKELVKLDNRQSWFNLGDPEGAMHSVLMTIQEDPTYKTRENLLDDVADHSNDPDKEVPAMSKAWDKAMKDGLIEEY